MSETQFAKAERLGLELYFLKEKVKKLEDKIAKLEKVAEAARRLLDECPNLYMETDGEEQFLEEALKELGEK